MEVLSAQLRELYTMFSLKPPVATEDMKDVRLDANDSYTDDDLIKFLEGKITAQSLLDKQPARDDNCLQTSD